MNLDLWILAALGLFGAIGFYTGAIQQFSHWIGLAAAYLCAKPLAAALAPALAARMGWPASLTAAGLSAITMPAILICAALLARAILNAVIPGDQRNTPDRLAGIALGAGKIGVIAWAALSVVLSIENSKAVPAVVKDALSASSAAAFTRRHSLFDSETSALQDRFRALAALSEDPKAARALLDDPALKSLFNDPAVKQALEKGETAALLENPKLKKMLEDPELTKKLEALAPR